MHRLIRRGALAGAALALLALAGTVWQSASASAYQERSSDGQPQTMDQFLTAVTKDVDGYWTKVFQDAGLPEPRVSYDWIPAGQTAQSVCGDESGTLGD